MLAGPHRARLGRVGGEGPVSVEWTWSGTSTPEQMPPHPKTKFSSSFVKVVGAISCTSTLAANILTSDALKQQEKNKLKQKCRLKHNFIRNNKAWAQNSAHPLHSLATSIDPTQAAKKLGKAAFLLIPTTHSADVKANASRGEVVGERAAAAYWQSLPPNIVGCRHAAASLAPLMHRYNEQVYHIDLSEIMMHHEGNYSVGSGPRAATARLWANVLDKPLGIGCSLLHEIDHHDVSFTNHKRLLCFKSLNQGQDISDALSSTLLMDEEHDVGEPYSRMRSALETLLSRINHSWRIACSGGGWLASTHQGAMTLLLPIGPPGTLVTDTSDFEVELFPADGLLLCPLKVQVPEGAALELSGNIRWRIPGEKRFGQEVPDQFFVLLLESAENRPTRKNFDFGVMELFTEVAFRARTIISELLCGSEALHVAADFIAINSVDAP